MSNLEDRRVSFGAGSSNAVENKRGPSPAPSDSRKSGSLSGSINKNKKSKGRKGSQSPKGSFSGAGTGRGSRRSSMKAKKESNNEQDIAANTRGRSDSLFKKSDVRYKEIRRALTKRQRDAKKNAESGEKRTQEL